MKSIAAAEIEEAVVDQLRAVFRTPEIITRTFREAKSREAEELDRMREENAELEETLARLRETASRLLDATGAGNGTLAAELRCTSSDIEDVRARLDSTDAQISVLEEHAVTERDVVDSLERLDPIWEELFPLEQHRIVSLLVDRVEVQDDGLEVRLRGDGLRSVVAELRRDESEARAG